jgi:hypothetical protein
MTVHDHAPTARVKPRPWVAEPTNTKHFNLVIDACEPAPQAMPPFMVDRAKPGLWPMVERQATALRRKWSLWAGAFEPRDDALRPPRWVMEHNPIYRGTRRSQRRPAVFNPRGAARRPGEPHL